MRGNKPDGDTTASFVEEDIEAAIIEREAAAFITGKTDERLRNASEELGIPFASLAARVSQSLGIQGKRSAMSLLQMRASAAGRTSVLQPEMALARRPHGLLPGKGETERASPSNSHQSNQSLTSDRIRDIQQRAKDGQSVNSIAKRFGLQWATTKKIIDTGAAPATPKTVDTILSYQQQRQLASGYYTAIKNGTSTQAVADRYEVSIYIAKKIYDRFDFSKNGANKYGTLKPEFRTGKGLRPANSVRRASPVRTARHKLTPVERNRLADAVARAIEKGGPAIRSIAESHHVSWFTAREAYETKFQKKLPKGGVVKKVVVEAPKAMAATG